MADQSHWERFEEEKDKYYKMKIDDWEKHMEWRESQWWYRLVSVYYSVKRFISDLPDDVRFAWQRATRGYDDGEIWGLDHAITKFVYPRIKEFARWQAEHGHGTPVDFVNDPAGWLEVLNKITRAFEISAEEDFLLGEDRFPSVPREKDYGTKQEFDTAIETWHKNNELRNKEQEEGYALFGKYIQNLWD